MEAITKQQTEREWIDVYQRTEVTQRIQYVFTNM